MPEPTVKPTEPGTSNGEGAVAGANQEAVDKAELERLQAADVRIKALDARAKEVGEGFMAEDYTDELEYIANKKPGDAEPAAPAAPAAPATPPVAGAEPTTPPVVQGGLSEDDKAQLTGMQKHATQAALGVQALEFQRAQDQIPEEERSLAVKADLDKIITRRTAAVGQLAPDYGGNVYAAAAALYGVSGDGQKKIADRATAAEKAKADAAAGSGLPTSGTVAPPAAGTPEADYAKAQQEAADAIVPDDPPFVMP